MAVRERERERRARNGGGVGISVCARGPSMSDASVDKIGRRKMRERFDPNGECGVLICPPLPGRGKKRIEKNNERCTSR